MGAPEYIFPPPTTGGTPVGGSGTTGTIPVWSTGTTLTNSGITDNGSTVTFVSRNLASSAAQTWTLASSTTALNIASNLLVFDTTNARIGIGTASPYAKLSVIGPNSTTDMSLGFAFNSAGDYRIGFATEYSSTQANQNKLHVRVSNATLTGTALVATYDGAGNVGIGTASPNARLQVGTTATFPVTKIGPSGGGGSGIIAFGDGANTALNVAVWRGAANSVTVEGNTLNLGSFDGIVFATSTAAVGLQTERMRISNAGAAADSQVAIGTTSFTSGRALTTVRDVDINGLRVGKGANASGTSNTAVGVGALDSVITSDYNTAVGSLAMQRMRSDQNVAVGRNALRGSVTLASNTGAFNVAVGDDALTAVSSGANNVAIGLRAGDSITTGSSNIVIGAGADTAAATTSNSLVVGDATNYVATNGGATTYYATAGASLGYIQVRLNGADVKIEVFAP